MSEDQFGLFNTDYDEKELGEGFAATADAPPPQWAFVEVDKAEYECSKKQGTHGVTCTLWLDSKMALTPNRRASFIRSYASIKQNDKGDCPGWRMFSRFAVALGLGSITLPPTKENSEKIARAVAVAAKGRKFIAWLTTEKDQNGIDRSRLQDYYVATEENLKAITDAGFDFNGVQVKSREENGRKRSYLVAKPRKEGAAATVAAGSSIAD